MSEKESLLEKESRDDGKRVQQCYILRRIEVAYKIYRLYSGRDSAGEFLKGKDTIFWRDSAAFWEEESRWSMGKFFNTSQEGYSRGFWDILVGVF